MTSPPAITTRGLTRRFGDLTAVDSLDLEIPAGGVVGLVGPNGSGKSTTIRMLLGLIRPSAGTAEVLGFPVDRPTAYADRVGALVESPAFHPGITARANLEAMAALRGVARSRVDAVLDVVDLRSRARERVSTYSLGMKQRLGIAMALLPDPDLLVLDEPTNGLDPAGIVEIRALLRRVADEGRTVVVSSHLLAEIQAAADQVVVIQSGRLLFSGGLDDLLQRAEGHIDVAPETLDDLPALAERYTELGWPTQRQGTSLRVNVDPALAAELNRAAAAAGVTLRRLEPSSESLEDVFIRLTDRTTAA